MLYLAEDPEKRTVAVKVLQSIRQLPKQADREAATQRVLNTAQQLSRLRHENIVRVYNAGEAEGLAYIVMEYLTGRDLSYYIDAEKLPLDEVFVVITKVAQGLSHAHTHGLIHRDIKPANIIYNRDSEVVKITDFDLSVVNEFATGSRKVFAGTPYYMAPEQTTGGPVDARADIYSLGATLFQLITGTPPFRADSLDKLIRKIQKESPPDILAVRPDLAGAGVCLRAIMDNVLQKKAKDRYQSCEEFIEDLTPCADVILNTLS